MYQDHAIHCTHDRGPVGMGPSMDITNLMFSLASYIFFFKGKALTASISFSPFLQQKCTFTPCSPSFYLSLFPRTSNEEKSGASRQIHLKNKNKNKKSGA
jgi:hypothetical protein